MKKFRKTTDEDIQKAVDGLLRKYDLRLFESFEDFLSVAAEQVYTPYLDDIITRDYYDVTFWYTWEDFERAVGEAWDTDVPF